MMLDKDRLKRIRPPVRVALFLAVGVILGSAVPALGQVATSGQLVQRSDGWVFWVQNGQRHVVYPASFSDEEINALPEGPPLNASLAPADAPAVTAPIVRQPTPAPIPVLGSSRASRLPLGQGCVCVLTRGTGQRSDLLISVTAVQRDAWRTLQQAHPSNQPPRDGHEYIIVTLDVNYVSGPRDLPVSLDRFDFSILDNNNTLYVPAFVVEQQGLISQTVYPGASVRANVAFQVPRGDPDLLLVWRYNDERPTWFAIQ